VNGILVSESAGIASAERDFEENRKDSKEIFEETPEKPLENSVVSCYNGFVVNEIDSPKGGFPMGLC